MSGTTRRDFIRTSSLAVAGALGFPNVVKSAEAGQKLKVAVIGAGGRGKAGMSAVKNEQLVAIADVDLSGRAAKAAKQTRNDFPDAKLYSDYRKLFDSHADELDAVWVATPDHNHFPASIRALKSGIPAYCEKPLTHNLWEARELRRVASETGLPTQMGNQGHSSESIRLICEYIQAGAIGEVTKLHCVSNRSFSADERPPEASIPEGLDWDCWLGPAPYRHYHEKLHPFKWRGYLDFGTASLGDMACHTIDGPVWALKLHESEQIEVNAEVGGVTAEGYTPDARIVYKFPARGELPPVTLTWWNGGGKENMPPRPEVLEEGRKQQTQGTYYYGSKGVMMSGSHCRPARLIPEELQRATQKPDQVIPRVPNHSEDFFRACRDSTAPAPSSNFEYSSRLTEIVLLGTVALRTGEKLTYDMKEGKFLNNDRANSFIRREPRKGWELGYDLRA